MKGRTLSKSSLPSGPFKVVDPARFAHTHGQICFRKQVQRTSARETRC
jgi:hypothetical protein